MAEAGPTQGAERHRSKVARWQARPGLARALRIAVLGLPLVLSLLFTFAMGRWYPPDSLGMSQWLWIVAVFVASNILLYVLVRLARLLTPLAALMTLSLVFPDQAPSRSKAALRRSSSAKMLREIQAAQLRNDGSAGALHADYLVQLLRDINAHDRLTRGHSERVRAYSELLGEELGLKGEELDKLRWGALLHDVGKLSVPAEILSKDGRPTDEEWELLKAHPAESETYLAPIEPWLGEWARAADEHHCRFDGTGYPHDLAGAEISLAGRIVAVADAYDVMTSARSYKKPLSPEVARQELTACAGTQFDPRVVSAFLRIGLGDLVAVAGPWAWLANLGGTLQLPVPVATGAATGAATSAWTAVAAAATLVAAAPVADQEGPFAFVPDPVVEQVEVAEPESVIVLDDAVPIDEDTSVRIDVLANDSGPDNGQLQISSVTKPAHGSVRVEGTEIVYTPDADFSGEDSFFYAATNGTAESSVGTVTITVNPVNDPPAIESSRATVSEGVPTGEPVLVISPSDPDGDAVVLTITNGDPAGIFELSGNTIRLVGELDYEARRSFVLEVTASDGIAQTQAVVTIQVVNVDERPQTGSETAETQEDSPVDIALGLNDVDPEDDALTWSLPSGTGAGGTLTLLGDSTARYTPPANFFGEDSFDYSVADGTHTQVESVVISVQAVRDAPTVARLTEASIGEGAIAGATVAEVAVGDVDGDSLTVAIVGGDPDGQFTVDDNGLIQVSDALDYETQSQYSLIVEVSDGQAAATGTVDVSVVDENDLPVAMNDVASATEDTVERIDIGANDSDVDGDALSWAVPAQSDSGGSLSEADGIVTYTPPAHFHGSDSFDYTVSDGVSSPISATVSIAVSSVLDPPTVESRQLSVGEDTPNGTVLGTIPVGDPDGDSLTVAITSGDPLGQFSIDSDGKLSLIAPLDFETTTTYPLEVSVSDGLFTTTGIAAVAVTNAEEPPVGEPDKVTVAEDGTVLIDVLANDSDPEGDSLILLNTTAPGNGVATVEGVQVRYTPDADYSGSDAFVYELSDGLNSSVAVAVFVTVTAVNDAPIAVDDVLTLDEDTTGTIVIRANDGDVDLDTLTWSVPASSVEGGLLSEANGVVTYVPVGDFSGADSFTYTVSDGVAPPVSAQVNITVTPVQDDPFVDAIALSISEQAAIGKFVGVVPAGDVDGDSITLQLTSGDPQGHFAIANDGTVTVAGPLDRETQVSYTIVVTVDDGVAQATAGLSVTVLDSNEPPTAGGDFIDTDEDTTGTVDLAANDADPEGELLTFAVPTLSEEGGAISELNGVVQYEPPADFFGTDSFTYMVSDPAGLSSAPATVSIVVYAVDDEPIAIADQGVGFTTDEDTPFTTASVLANDTDADGAIDPAWIEVLTLPEFGSLTNRGDGTFEYSPAADFAGTDGFTYRIVEPGGLDSDPVEVVLEVGLVNDPPVANPDELTISVAGTTPAAAAVSTANLLANDTDAENDSLNVIGVGSASEGTVTLGSTGVQYSYTGTGSVLADTFTYQISDGNGGVATGTVTVEIVPAEDSDGVSAESDVCPLVYDPLQLDADGDGVGDACDASPTVASTPLFTRVSDPQAEILDFSDTSNSDTHAFAVGDVDGDGDLDVAAAMAGDDALARNDGTGTGVSAIDWLSGSHSENVAFGDLDEDGDLDLVVATWSDGNEVWLNNGAGGFTDTGQSLGPDSDTTGVAVADFDGDGDLDIVFANATGTNRAFTNDGSGTFSPGEALGTEAYDIALGDLDGDGDADIVFGEKESNSIFLSNGDGTFTDLGNALSHSDSRAVALGDVDGDGDLDVILGYLGSERVRIGLNDGTGSFTDIGQALAGQNTTSLDVGDIDGDGDLDIAVGDSSAQVRILINDGAGNFHGGVVFGPTTATTDVKLADLDGDGDLDLLLAREGEIDSVWLNS